MANYIISTRIYSYIYAYKAENELPQELNKNSNSERILPKMKENKSFLLMVNWM